MNLKNNILHDKHLKPIFIFYSYDLNNIMKRNNKI